MLQVSLLTENGNIKDDLRLPTDENLLSQVSSSMVVFFENTANGFALCHYSCFSGIGTFRLPISCICFKIVSYLSVFAQSLSSDLSDDYHLVVPCLIVIYFLSLVEG